MLIKVKKKKRRKNKGNQDQKYYAKNIHIVLKNRMLTSKLAVVSDTDSAVAVVSHGCHLSSTACTVLRTVIQ